MKEYSFRQQAGALLLDAPRLLWVLHGTGRWIRCGNRRDRLRFDPDGRGVACDWEFTRTLHVCDVFPAFGRKLLDAALREWPIRQAPAPAFSTPEEPEVSFIIGHRGMDRLASLRRVIETIAAQEGVRCECLVVEQEVSPQIREHLPDWVRHAHTPPPDADMPYCRSWAFNAGAALARGRLLIFHDNDLLVPAAYAARAWKLFEAGYEAIHLKRFIFYRPSTDAGGVERVLENLVAGGSVAVARGAFEAIGGFDEQFIGWGGEDNEFWDRCLTRKVWDYACLPMIHLWHAAQEGKRAVNGMGRHTAGLTLRRRAMDPMVRIAELKVRPRGAPVWPPRPILADSGERP